MYNKKGFTLVEILAVITIIAVLAISATAGVASMLQKQRQKLAYTAEENISESSLSYFSKNANYLKPCTDSTGAYTTITQKNIDDLNKYLRNTKFAGHNGEALYQLYRNYSINCNSDPTYKHELDSYIKVKNRACYKLITVGELIEQGLINDADGMCNKSSMVIVYRKADAKNTAGIMTSVQESGICKSTRKTESGPVITISPISELTLTSSKNITVTVTTESTKLKSSFTMQYGWSKDEMIKPSSWNNLNFTGNTEKNGSATIPVNTINETRYLWIKAGTVLDNKNNKTSNIKAGPYAFLPSVIVNYDVNSGDASSCPATKTVVFTKAYGKDRNGNEANLCTPTRTGFDFKGWYRDGTKNIINTTTVDIKNDHSLVAKWEPHDYTITLDKNGATNSPTSSIGVKFFSNALNPSSITLPQRSNTVSGFGLDSSRKSNGATVSSTSTLNSNYTFNGWTTTRNGSTTLINNSATPVLQANVSGYTNSSSQWIKTSNITVYAKWSSSPVILPTITKTGYICGWTTSATGKDIELASGSSYTPTANTILYGVCKANTYTIVYAANNTGITGSTPNTQCVYDQNCEIRKSGYALKEGKMYIKYWKDASDIRYNPNDKVKNLTAVNNGTVTLYGHWDWYRLYIRYNGNGNVKWCGDNPDYFYMDNDTKFAWHLLGPNYKTWTDKYHFSKYYSIIGETTNHGVNDPNAHGLICFEKTGYHAKDHKEWNTKRDGTGYSMDKRLQDTGAVVAQTLGCDLSKHDCNIDVYVNWEPNTFNIKYNANGGTGAPADHTCTYDKNCKLTTSKPKLNHAKFNGWKKENKGGTLSPGESVKNATSKDKETITYYAQYKCRSGYHKDGNKCEKN